MANKFEYKLEFTTDKENIKEILELTARHLKYALYGEIVDVKTTVTLIDGNFFEEDTEDAEE